MTYTPTNRPVPSDAPEDLYFNSSTLDKLVTGPAGVPVVDRAGIPRKSWATIEADNAGLAGDLAGDDGTSLIGYLQGPGAMPMTLQDVLQQTLPTPERWGAVGDGTDVPVSAWYTPSSPHYRGFADLAAVQAVYPHVVSGSDLVDGVAIQKCINEFKTFFMPSGKRYKINTTIRQRSGGSGNGFAGRGVGAIGAGARNVTISNTVNNKPLWTFGDPGSGEDAINCALVGVSLIGNASTLEGLAILGDDDDGLPQASRGVYVNQVRISGCGAGAGLRVSAWAGWFGYVEVEGNLRGLALGNHVYSATFLKYYNVSSVNEAVYVDDSVPSSKLTQVVFVGPVLQGCGASGQAIYCGGGAGLNFISPYIENLNALATAAFRFGANNRSSRVTDLFYTKGDGPDTVDIIETSSPALTVDGIDGRGNVVSFVKILGSNPGTRIYNLEHPTGTRSSGKYVDDQSTNKRTITDLPKTPTESVRTPIGFQAATTEAALRWLNRASGTIQGFIQNGRIYFGADDTAINLQAAGSSISVLNGSSGAYGGVRSTGNRFAETNIVDAYRASGTPEGVLTAEPGSTCRVQTGASAGLWKKDTGTGNTGWVKL